jgi:hypothetical protein
MTRKLVLGIATVAFAGAIGLQAIAQDSFQQHVDRAIAKTREIDKLIDGIGSRQTAGGGGGGARVQTAAAVETLKCATCGMEMSTKRANRRQKAVKIKGKTYYCCAGCDMSKIADK